jgi:hypothetical protein
MGKSLVFIQHMLGAVARFIAWPNSRLLAAYTSGGGLYRE